MGSLQAAIPICWALLVQPFPRAKAPQGLLLVHTGPSTGHSTETAKPRVSVSSQIPLQQVLTFQSAVLCWESFSRFHAYREQLRFPFVWNQSIGPILWGLLVQHFPQPPVLWLQLMSTVSVPQILLLVSVKVHMMERLTAHGNRGSQKSHRNW